MASLKVGTGEVLAATVVGMAAFVGVLLYAPVGGAAVAGSDRSDRAGLLQDTRSMVAGQARAQVRRRADLEALRTLDRQLDSDKDWAWGWMFTAQVAQRGNDLDTRRFWDRAMRSLSRLDEDGALSVAGSTDYRRFFVAGWGARASGDEARARELFFEGLSVLTSQVPPDSTAALYDGACFLALAGEQDEAARRMAELLGGGYSDVVWIMADPDLDPIREHPVFRDAVRARAGGGSP